MINICFYFVFRQKMINKYSLFLIFQLKVPWISSNLKLADHLESICIDESYSSDALVVRACRRADYCLDHLCVRKCCPVNQNLQRVSLSSVKCIDITPNATIKSLHSALVRSNVTELNDFRQRFSRTTGTQEFHQHISNNFPFFF